MNRAELTSIVKCRLESEPDIPGGQILAELLESIGHLPGEEMRLKRMTCGAIVSSYLTRCAQRPQRVVASERKRIKKFSTLEAFVERLESSNKIVAIVGAGASTSAGLPDFRSEGGLYDQIRADYGEQFDDPQLLFDAAQFKLDPTPFFRVAHKLFPPSSSSSVSSSTSCTNGAGKDEETKSAVHPTRCHKFLAKLEQEDKLLRCYTQNVDGLETLAGVTRVVSCHGTLSTSTCTCCGAQFPTHIESPDRIPTCPKGDGGILRPNIVFFGQDLPLEYKLNVEKDIRDTDLVLVIGSSLKVFPVASLITRFHHRVPMVLINREVVGKPNEFDVELLGDCDTIVEELERRWNWGSDEEDSDNDGDDDNEPSETSQERTCCYEYLPPNTYLFTNAKIEEEEKQRRRQSLAPSLQEEGRISTGDKLSSAVACKRRRRGEDNNDV